MLVNSLSKTSVTRLTRPTARRGLALLPLLCLASGLVCVADEAARDEDATGVDVVIKDMRLALIPQAFWGRLHCRDNLNCKLR